jgi:hypothetical protein
MRTANVQCEHASTEEIADHATLTDVVVGERFARQAYEKRIIQRSAAYPEVRRG